MAVLKAQNGGLAIKELKLGTYCNKVSFFPERDIVIAPWAFIWWLPGLRLRFFVVFFQFLKANFVTLYRTGHGHFYLNTV